MKWPEKSGSVAQLHSQGSMRCSGGVILMSDGILQVFQPHGSAAMYLHQWLCESKACLLYCPAEATSQEHISAWIQRRVYGRNRTEHNRVRQKRRLANFIQGREDSCEITSMTMVAYPLSLCAHGCLKNKMEPVVSSWACHKIRPIRQETFRRSKILGTIGTVFDCFAL